jgi:arylsulfatase A-like enzyme
MLLRRLIPTLWLFVLGACSPGPDDRPNVLLVVWDTVRADHLGLYGYARETTPFLEAWAEDARVFEDCVSAAGYTLPSHASMFTGVLPSEHCAHNGHRWLNDEAQTLAELLADHGYQTYLYAANPNVSKLRNLSQGFDEVEHPWSEPWRERAAAIVRAKVDPRDRSSELTEQIEWDRQGDRELTSWNVKASGELAEEALSQWLATARGDRPWFAVLNYMEAHRPTIPPRRYREMFMTADEIEASYQVDRSWLAVWEYTFGLRDYTATELHLTRLTYDATLRELDDLFASLVTKLKEQGQLENTVVILVSDHGESLGEHHMLDHQFSLYDTLLKVPLVVKAPGRLMPGRDRAPVMNLDVFPTILELAGIDVPDGLPRRAVSLFSPNAVRLRTSEEPMTPGTGTAVVKEAHPEFDPSVWRMRIRAIRDDRHKLIWKSSNDHELYDLVDDPQERRNGIVAWPKPGYRLLRALRGTVASLQECDDSQQPPIPMTPEEIERLKSLGYQ